MPKLDEAGQILKALKARMTQSLTEAQSLAERGQFAEAIAQLDQALSIYNQQKKLVRDKRVASVKTTTDGVLLPQYQGTFAWLNELEEEVSTLFDSINRMKAQYTSEAATARPMASNTPIPSPRLPLSDRVEDLTLDLAAPIPPIPLQPPSVEPLLPPSPDRASSVPSLHGSPTHRSSAHGSPLHEPSVRASSVRSSPARMPSVESPAARDSSRHGTPVASPCAESKTPLESDEESGRHSETVDLPTRREEDEEEYNRAWRQLEELKKQPHPQALDKPLNDLMQQVNELKKTEELSELTETLNKTYLRLTNNLPSKDYDNIAKTMQGSSSNGLKILGGIMISLGLVVATLGIVFAPVLISAIAAIGLAGTAGTIAGGVTAGLTSAALIGEGIRLFSKGCERHGLSKAMQEIDSTDLDLKPEEQQQSPSLA